VDCLKTETSNRSEFADFDEGSLEMPFLSTGWRPEILAFARVSQFSAAD